jgi:hypothetical protein
MTRFATVAIRCAEKCHRLPPLPTQKTANALILLVAVEGVEGFPDCFYARVYVEIIRKCFYSLYKSLVTY